MSTDLLSTVLRRSVERKGVLPLSEQLRSAVEMAVIGGEFTDGTPLPSVRRLAHDLKLAPNTVVRAYGELEAEGIVQVVPRRGYFVRGPREQPGTATSEELAGLLDEAVRAARQDGLTDNQVLHLVAERLRSRDGAVRRVGVVGRRDAALAERALVIAEGVKDLGVEVVSLSFEELRTPEGAARAVGMDFYVVPVLETDEAATLLGPHANRIMPMNRRLKQSVLSFVGAQPPETLFGIIAGADQYRGRMIAALQKLHPLRTPPLVASVRDPRSVDRAIRTADVLIIGSTAVPYMNRRPPLSIPSIEFTYIPDESTIARIRARLSKAALPRRRDVANNTGARRPVATPKEFGRARRSAPGPRGRPATRH